MTFKTKSYTLYLLNILFSDQWENYHLNWLLGQDIRDSTVGFYGFGGIGQAIAKRLGGFDIDRVLYTTRRRVAKDIEEEYNAKKVDFDTLLAESDFIVIASPLTKDTEGVFNATAFNKMKETAVLVNIARGSELEVPQLYKHFSIIHGSCPLKKSSTRMTFMRP